VKVEQGKAADLLAVVATEEVDQSMGGRDICTNGMRRTATAMGKMTRPTCSQGPRRMFSTL
jgi:hypothetical protein